MSPDYLVVQDGVLNITAAQAKFEAADYLGAQLTTWNRVCFQGGFLEARFKPAGIWNQEGLWPAIWSMGNLLRDNYMIRNRHIWPYSYSDCQCPGSFWHGIGRGQEVSACSARGDYGTNRFQGRGAVEFDLLETSKCSHFETSLSQSVGIYSDGTCLLQTYQIGPALSYDYTPPFFYEPGNTILGYREWYGVPWYNSSKVIFQSPTIMNTVPDGAPLSHVLTEGTTRVSKFSPRWGTMV